MEEVEWQGGPYEHMIVGSNTTTTAIVLPWPLYSFHVQCPSTTTTTVHLIYTLY